MLAEDQKLRCGRPALTSHTSVCIRLRHRSTRIHNPACATLRVTDSAAVAKPRRKRDPKVYRNFWPGRRGGSKADRRRSHRERDEPYETPTSHALSPPRTPLRACGCGEREERRRSVRVAASCAGCMSGTRVAQPQGNPRARQSAGQVRQTSRLHLLGGWALCELRALSALSVLPLAQSRDLPSEVQYRCN